MKATLKRMQNEIIEWWKEQTYQGKVIILFLGVGAIFLCFKYPDPTRNLILLIAGIIGWYFLNRRTITAEENTKAAEESAQATRQNATTAEQGLTVERFTRATEQLASKNSSVRLGGIISLEQIAKHHPEDQRKIARMLISFIRTRAAKDSKEAKKDFDASGVSELKHVDDFSAYRAQRLDIEVAVNALANIASELEKQGQFSEEYNEQKIQLCDLQNTDLRGLRFVKADLSKFDFGGADMSGAWLTRANLSEAWLYKLHDSERTKLIFVKLDGVNFKGAFLNLADFHGVDSIRNADFSDAALQGVNFAGVQITKSNLSNTNLENADFTGASLTECKIDGASLENANLTNAKFVGMRDLSQQQIEKTFRWKVHISRDASADDSLKLSPEKERPTGFWVYKIWNPPNVAHARIHVPWCSFCNNGKGTNKEKKPQGDGYDWIFCNSYDEALNVLEDFRKEHNCNNVGNCRSCQSRGDLSPPSSQS